MLLCASVLGSLRSNIYSRFLRNTELNIAFVIDPLNSLSLKKDSTLSMIRASQKKGWEISYLMQKDLMLKGFEPYGIVRSLKLRETFLDTLEQINHEPWFTAGEPIHRPLADFDVIMMRKDPPFDMEYVYSTYILERAATEGVLVVNSPQAIRDCNEKFFATAFPQCCPPLLVSRSPEELSLFHKEHGATVFKPLDGMGGESIFRVTEDDPNLQVIIETLTQHGSRQIMAQKFLPDIESGDKRILLINGKPLPYALARIPMKGEARGNLAAGGKGVGQQLSKRDRWISEQVGPELKRRGVIFAGIDVIGDYLTEINITCPTCIRQLDEQFSLDIGLDLMNAIEISMSESAGNP